MERGSADGGQLACHHRQRSIWATPGIGGGLQVRGLRRLQHPLHHCRPFGVRPQCDHYHHSHLHLHVCCHKPLHPLRRVCHPLHFQLHRVHHHLSGLTPTSTSVNSALATSTSRSSTCTCSQPQSPQRPQLRVCRPRHLLLQPHREQRPLRRCHRPRVHRHHHPPPARSMTSKLSGSSTTSRCLMH